MLRVAICDDMFIDLFSDGDSLMVSHIARPFDIILRDIIMPMLNGIDTAAEIRKLDKSVKIVFLTSSAEFAVDSYKVHADNYLLKPVDPESLYSCLDDGFFKCHRSYIVNIYHIDTYTQKVIRMKSGAHIPISRDCHTAFETTFFNLMFS